MDSPNLRSHVDGLEGAYITGWAFRQGERHCPIAVTDDTGRPLATGLANVEREDLRAIARDRCDIAFRIRLPSLDRARFVRVFAGHTEITGAPIPLGAGRFDGFVAVGGVLLDGWVAERVPDFAAPLITATDQHGVEVLRCRSQKAAHPEDVHFQPARFSASFHDNAFGRGELLLTVCANGVAFASCSICLPLFSYAEIVSAERCAGWLLSPVAPDRAFAIEIRRDGVLEATARTTLPRPDVQHTHHACRLSGFDAALPPLGALAPAAVTLSLRLENSPLELFDGPFVAGRRDGLVETARRLARLGLADTAGLDAGQLAVLQQALKDFLIRARGQEQMNFPRQAPLPAMRAGAGTRLSIVIPVYRGAEITRTCLDSVLAARGAHDRVVIVDDATPDAEIAALLPAYRGLPNVFILTNAENIGFVRSVNRALAFCAEGDVLLLNSDTEMFAGGIDELCHIAASAPDIGTVTALSNNATIFSYPHPGGAVDGLADVGWRDLAAEALARNRGRYLDVPTGHGFCLLIRRAVIARLGLLDESFGRGYGEENDYCAKAADLGYRNVAAAAVFVQHKESHSFGAEKDALLRQNMRLLHARYPDYAETIRRAEEADCLRGARWALDMARLVRMVREGTRFVLLISNALGGGTRRAIDDIAATVGYRGATPLTLSAGANGLLSLTCDAPNLKASFAADEADALVEVLGAAEIGLVLAHQLLGLPQQVLHALARWAAGRQSLFYAHDFYPLCPRVTMIDAVGNFCGLAAPEVCERCVALGGAHEFARLDGVAAAEHRALFGEILGGFRAIVAPSENAASYYRAAFPALDVRAIPHPAPAADYPRAPRAGDFNEVVLFGAIGPHKGAAELAALAYQARLTHPRLQFRVIGYTDRDAALRAIGNVTVTGPYDPRELASLVDETRGCLALFLQQWPETFSYTLSEAARFGFIPVVPDLGAPKDRVLESGYGVVYETPAGPQAILALIDDIAQGRRRAVRRGAHPGLLAPAGSAIEATAALYWPEAGSESRKRAGRARSR